MIAEIGEDTVIDPDVVGSLVPSSYDNLIETAVNLIQSGSWRSPNESGREVMRQRDVWGSVEEGLSKVLANHEHCGALIGVNQGPTDRFNHLPHDSVSRFEEIISIFHAVTLT